jgi:hypothetical protein
MEAYRIAFDLATKELQEIVSKFEQLRARKELLEKTVEALGPLVEHIEKEAATTQPEVDRTTLTMQERFDLAMAKASVEAESGTGMIAGAPTPSQTFTRRDDIYFGESQR